MERLDLDHCLRVASQAVSLAAEKVLESFKGHKTVSTKSAWYDLVTETDKTTEIQLIGALREAFPDHKFIAEETKSEGQLTNEPTWIIDPIDGTTNFVHGFPYFGLCVGLAVDREVVLGIVSAPALDQVFTALKGKGAYLNGERIQTTNVTELKDAVLGQEMSLASIPRLTDIFVERYRRSAPHVQGIRSIGSAQMSLCQVALGTTDCFQVEHLYPWDVAAGSVIVTEAGGVVLDINGGKFDSEKGRIIAACTPELGQKLVELFKEK